MICRIHTADQLLLYGFSQPFALLRGGVVEDLRTGNAAVAVTVLMNAYGNIRLDILHDSATLLQVSRLCGGFPFTVQPPVGLPRIMDGHPLFF